MAKYYSLDEKVALKLQLISEENLQQPEDPNENLKLFKDRVETYKNTVSLFKNKIDMLDLYTELLDKIEIVEDSAHIDSDLQHLITNYEIGYQAQYLTEEQYRKFIEYYHEFYAKVRDMIINDKTSDKIVERPYFSITVMMPLKKLLDLELGKIKRKNKMQKIKRKVERIKHLNPDLERIKNIEEDLKKLEEELKK